MEGGGWYFTIWPLLSEQHVRYSRVQEHRTEWQAMVVQRC